MLHLRHAGKIQRQTVSSVMTKPIPAIPEELGYRVIFVLAFRKSTFSSRASDYHGLLICYQTTQLIHF